jgi:hypothetical protein
MREGQWIWYVMLAWQQPLVYSLSSQPSLADRQYMHDHHNHALCTVSYHLMLQSVRVRWVNHKCKVNSDVFVRVSEETGVKILSSLA